MTMSRTQRYRAKEREQWLAKNADRIRNLQAMRHEQAAARLNAMSPAEMLNADIRANVDGMYDPYANETTARGW